MAVDVTKTDARINRCPFCKSTKVCNWLSHDAAPDMWCVMCEECGAEGPHTHNEEQSIYLWNWAENKFAHVVTDKLGESKMNRKVLVPVAYVAGAVVLLLTAHDGLSRLLAVGLVLMAALYD